MRCKDIIYSVNGSPSNNQNIIDCKFRNGWAQQEVNIPRMKIMTNYFGKKTIILKPAKKIFFIKKIAAEKLSHQRIQQRL